MSAEEQSAAGRGFFGRRIINWHAFNRYVLNRQEQRALVLLAAALLVGGGVNLHESYRPGGAEGFRLVPAAVEVPPVAPVSPAPAGRLRLNTADAAGLQTLPGIGPQMARRILAARRAQGPFRRLEDLRRVRGIGPRTLEKLRPLVEID